MTLQVFGSAALLVAAAVLVGEAIGLLGARCRAAGPAVGLAVLIIVTDVTIRLPGRTTTASVVLLLVVIAAAVIVVVGRRGRPPSARGVALGAVTVAVSAFAAAIPFLANGRIGLLGVGLDNDTANHLLWAEALRSPLLAQQYPLPGGYPLGPHSLVATISSGLGVRLDLSFSVLMVSTVVITALVGSAALAGEAAWKRLITGVLAALLYLPAAYYAEGAFKEPLLGLFLLAFVLTLEEVRGDWQPQLARQFGSLVPVSLLVAGALYVYSYPALAWLGLTVALWVVAEVATRPGWLRRWRVVLIDVVPPAGLAAIVLVIVVAPNAGRIASFLTTIGTSPSGTGAISASSLGNLARPLSPFEALGIWNSLDFRLAPTDLFGAGALSAFALGVLLLGFVWSVGRREFLLPAAIGACAIVYWRSSLSQSPYVTAKALAIAGPVVAAIGLRGLLRSRDVVLPRLAWLARLLVAVAFVALAVHSTYNALRDEPVWPAESTNELLALDKLTRGQPVLFLGASDYAPWLFSTSLMSALAPTTVSLAQAQPRPTKPNTYGTALDFDSVDPSSLDRFKWVVTSNTPAASQAPNAFRLVRQMPMYQLWERVGQVTPRVTIEAAGAPGGVFNCRVPGLRALTRHKGVAATMSAPISAGLGTVQPGGTEQARLRLPAGRWQLSLQYTSPVDIKVTAPGRAWRMPAYADRPGPLFAVGPVVSTGAPVPITIHADRPSVFSGPNLLAFTTAIVATRSPNRRTLVPMNRACGRYVDWYRLG